MATDDLSRQARENFDQETIKSLIRTVPDHPKPGIMFRDITTLVKDPVGFRMCIDEMVRRYEDRPVDTVASVESRGFIFGSALAYRLGAGFVPIRKQGRLPAATIGRSYQLEYGSARMEIHADALRRGEKVVIVDDLIATGGTAEAAARLVEIAGGEVVECCFIIDLPDIGGRKRLRDQGIASHALCAFEGD